jgi:DNA repair protein RecO (recombination protein O)
MLAIVLGRRDAGEYDRIASLFTKERGKVEAFVKGVKKITGKNGPFLEPFFLIEAETVANHELDKFIKAYPLESFQYIRGDIRKMRLAGYAAYFLNICTQPGVKNEDVFNLFLNWLKFLNRTKEARVNILYGLMIKIFAHLGFEPVLSSCSRCGAKLARAYKNIYFFVPEGGIVCSSCLVKFPELDKGAVKLSLSEYMFLRTMLNSGWELINKIKREAFEEKIRKLILEFIQYRLERKLAEFSEI